MQIQIKCPLCSSDNYTELLKTVSWHQGIFFEKEIRIVCCSQCGMTFINPSFESKDYSKFYEKEYFQLNVTANEKEISEGLNIETIKYLDAFPIFKTQNFNNLLDIGSGYGAVIDYFIKNNLINYKNIYALEPSSDAGSFLSNKYGITVHEEMIENNTLPENSFELITAFNLIEHVLNPVEVMKKIFDLSKVGGSVLICTPCLDERSLERGAKWFKVVHTLYFTKNTLENLMKTVGFHIIETQVIPSGNGKYNMIVCFAIKKDTPNLESIEYLNNEIQMMIYDSKIRHPIKWLKNALLVQKTRIKNILR